MLAISAVRVGKTERPVTQGVRSPKVRWIFPGQMETAVAEWFGRFPAMTAAALVFAQPLPGSVEPGPDESRSYAGWLYQPGATTQYSPGPGEASRRSR
jgi:hypothetical protein